jgi:hypothetical protein
MEEEFYRLDADRRIALVRKAIEAGQPLMIRWAEIATDFGDRWQARAATAAKWLAAASTIVDLGCGTMTLEGYLRPGQCYIPVDLARRDQRTFVIDLNQGADLARLPSADACALLGVLEYIYGPHDLMAALRRTYRQVVASFNLRRDEESVEDRLGHGWVNHFTHGELLSLFADHGYASSRFHLIEGRRHEYLFDLQRVEG